MKTGWGRAAGIRVAGFVCALVLAALPCLLAASAPAGSVITNTATVRYADANGNPRTPALGTASTTLEAAPVLRAVKHPSSDPVAMGGRLSYTIDYENAGNAPAAGITLADTLSPLVSPVAYAPAILRPAAGGQPARLVWNIPALAAGEKGRVQFSVDVSADPAIIRDGDRIVNLLDIASPQTGSQSLLVTIVGQAPNLQVELSASRAEAGPGDEINYTISYTNKGNLPSTASLLSVRLPDETALVEGSIIGNGGIRNRLISWDLGSLAPGAAGRVSFTLRISPLAREGILLQLLAALSCAELGSRTSPEVTTVVRSQRLLTLIKTASSEAIRVGDMLGYTLELRNAGNVPLTNVVLRDLLPAGTRLVSTTGQAVGEAVIWQFPLLGPGEVRRGTLELLVGSEAVPLGPVMNHAEAWNIDTPTASSSTRTPIISSNRSVIEFITADGRPVTTFDLDVPIGIRVTDLSENHEPRRVESIQVTLINRDTGDSEPVRLIETGSNTGVFEGTLQQTRSMPATPGDGFLSTSEDNTLAVSYADPEFPGEPSLVDLAWVNPVGVVFDSLSGLPVKGAKITLYDSTTGQPADFSIASDGPASRLAAVRANFTFSGEDGKFTFGPIPPGSYHLLVESPEYLFPSNAATATLAPQYLIETGSRGEGFTITAEPTPIVFDIPLDREAKDLLLEKSSSKMRASIGELVPFTVTLTNRSPGPLNGLRVIDTLPHGMQYVPGSARLDGKTVADPDSETTRTLTWTLPTLVTQTKAVLSYVTIIGPGVRPGLLSNLARAEALHLGRSVSSRAVSATIDVREGLFTERGTVLGKVFLDRDGNGRQNASGEVGIPGIGLYLEDGTHVTTDEQGQYSVPGILPGAHLMRLDPTMLPADAEPAAISNRDRDDPRTRLIELPHGGLFKADFPLRPGPGFILPVASSSATLPGSGTRPLTPISGPSSWENVVGSMTPGFEILAPADGYQNAGHLLKLVVKSPPDDFLRISVDGHALEGLKPGKTISRRDAGVRVQEFYGVPLITEATSTVAVERVDAAGSVLERRSILVYAAGAGVELRLTPPAGGIRADGVSVGVIRVELLDRHGRIVNNPLSVTIESGKGELLTRDVDPGLEGVQMNLEGGCGEIAIRAPRETGTSELVVRGGGMIGKAALEFVPDLKPMVVLGLGELLIGKGSARGDTTPMRRWEGFEGGTYAGGRGAIFLRGEIGGDVLVT
ncbi:MAG TPA: hypothetical protein PLP29_19310, partial [Candidatus Ozemobacteraceae bacterium]|nr:hypothetical protein [Candidatus Ozemobacteraceae bacterium]